MPRTYTLKRRAERQEATRRRIVDAAVELHQTIGPARASISAIAGRAGVERKTFYRHFPDLDSLFRACSARYRTLNPLPDPARWLEVADPQVRLRRGLGEAYAYYRRNEAMIANVLRDAAFVPVGGGFIEHRARMLEALAEGWRLRGRRQNLLRGALRVALDFHVWQELARGEGLSDREAVELMAGLVREAAGPKGTAT